MGSINNGTASVSGHRITPGTPPGTLTLGPGAPGRWAAARTWTYVREEVWEAGAGRRVARGIGRGDSIRVAGPAASAPGNIRVPTIVISTAIVRVTAMPRMERGKRGQAVACPDARGNRVGGEHGRAQRVKRRRDRWPAQLGVDVARLQSRRGNEGRPEIARQKAVRKLTGEQRAGAGAGLSSSSGTWIRRDLPLRVKHAGSRSPPAPAPPWWPAARPHPAASRRARTRFRRRKSATLLRALPGARCGAPLAAKGT